MAKQYLLIYGSEDGAQIIPLDDLAWLSEADENYSVENFMDEFPDNMDTNYWDEGSALLLEVKILKPRAVKTSWKVG